MTASLFQLSAIAALLVPSLAAVAAAESRCAPVTPSAVQSGAALAPSETAGNPQMSEVQVMMLLHQLDGRGRILSAAVPPPGPNCCEVLRSTD
ncbi:MAG: hypothetical protein IPL03_12850 [Sterolibacteriaceae bacterium]|nr:hypothetical protein [Candidatus Methylophosphatis haderslevensis]